MNAIYNILLKDIISVSLAARNNSFFICIVTMKGIYHCTSYSSHDDRISGKFYLQPEEKLQKTTDDELTTEIVKSNLSTRIINTLRQIKIDNDPLKRVITIEDIQNVRERDLLKILNFGQKSLKELKDYITPYGIKLKP